MADMTQACQRLLSHIGSEPVIFLIKRFFPLLVCMAFFFSFSAL